MTTLVYMKHKYQINLVLVLVFQLFAYILQQFKYLKLPEKTIAIKSKYLSNYSIKVSRNQFLYKFISWKKSGTQPFEAKSVASIFTNMWIFGENWKFSKEMLEIIHDSALILFYLLNTYCNTYYVIYVVLTIIRMTNI